jgi:hypothetical protein
MQAKTAAAQQKEPTHPTQAVQPAQPTQPGTAPDLAPKLLRAIVIKSFLELLFICFLATWAAFINYSPLLRGAIDQVDEKRVAGWAHDPQTPNEALEVQLFIDDRFIAARRADERRDDLVRAKAANSPHHGFSFNLQAMQLAPGQHAVQVYAVRTAAGKNKMLIPLSRTPLIFHAYANQVRSQP